MRLKWLVFALALALAFSGCAKRRPVRVAKTPALGSVERGIASWYGHPYHGRRAASGEIYDMEKLTAAHRTMPFGTMVRVHSEDNGRSVEVRINDRGPFVDGRIIDVSRAAARELDMIGPGTAKVRIVVTAFPQPREGEYYGVQVGAFSDRNNAERRLKAVERYGPAKLVRREGEVVLWRVVVGKEPTQEGASELARKLRAEIGPAFVVRVDGNLADHF